MATRYLWKSLKVPKKSVTDTLAETTENSEGTETISEPVEFDAEDRFFEKRYGKVLQFLWSWVHEETEAKPTHLIPCCRKTPIDWSDRTHNACLQPKSPLVPPQSASPPGPAPMRMELGSFDNAVIAMAKLSDGWERKIEMEVHEKEVRDQRKKE